VLGFEEATLRKQKEDTWKSKFIERVPWLFIAFGAGWASKY